MATLEQRLTLLAGAIRDKINLMMPRLIPTGGAVNEVLAKTGAGNFAVGWQAPLAGPQGPAGPPGNNAGCQVRVPVPINSYAHLAVNGLALTTIAAASNRLDFMPFIPARTITVNQLELEVSTSAGSGASGRLGIYASGTDGLPTTLVVQGGATIDCTSTGNKTATISSTVLSAGTLYWIAVASSNNQTYRGLAVGALLPLEGNATANAMYTLRRATFTFASLPATAPATTLTSATAPHVRLRVSA
jgi:hypothetical protein